MIGVCVDGPMEGESVHISDERQLRSPLRIMTPDRNIRVMARPSAEDMYPSYNVLTYLVVDSWYDPIDNERYATLRLER